MIPSEVREALEAAYAAGLTSAEHGSQFEWWLDSAEGKSHLDAINRVYAEMYY